MSVTFAPPLTRWRPSGDLLLSPALTSLGLVAGSTTRSLGSMGGSATAADEAAAARARLAARLGFAEVVRVKQVHGSDVVRADRAFASPWPAADALWTGRAGVLLGVVAADCVPILVADAGGRIGAAHAGWEGTTRSVARRLVETLRAAGAAPSRLVASLGPSIGPCCYSVGAERAAAVRDRLGDAAERALVPLGDGVAFDLWRANVDQLRAAGVGTIEVSGICTRCGGADTWSRRSGDVGLLGLAFIGRRGDAP